MPSMILRAKRDMIAKKARDLIKKHGWMIQAVGREEDGSAPGFSYTVGLSTKFKHPEIYLVDIHHQMAQNVLNAAARQVRDGLRFDRPCFSNRILENYPAAFMPMEGVSTYEHSYAGRFYLHHDFEAVQLILPDAEARFPWDEGFNSAFAPKQMALLKVIGDPPEKGIWVPPIN